MTTRQGAAEIRLFGLQRYLLQKRRRLFHALRDERLALARTELKVGMLGGLNVPLTLAVVMAGVVVLVARGQLSVGAYAAYFRAVELFSGTFFMLFWTTTVLDNDLRYIRDLFDFLQLEDESSFGRQNCGFPRDHAARLLSSGIPEIRFEQVSFTYPEARQPVLQQITLTLRAGERIALVGENGAGKSTLAKILLGLYRPTSGRITVDGAELGALAPEEWRARVVAVFQDYMKYELTARENIGFGDLDRLDDLPAIHAAAERSGADTIVVALPTGYETILGRAYDEHGQDLSQGQWQKLAIARAYLRDAAVLVLDEPTAALDARAEVDVYRRFRDMAQGKSVLLISHRLGSARLADRILVLEHGRIVEEGSHTELIARGGRYARMYATQAQWYN
jgi:ATP-binding cassette subfamily B protein